MPYIVEKRGSKWVKKNKKTGEIESVHSSKEKADKSVAAYYAKDVKHDNKDLEYDIIKKDEAKKRGDYAEAKHYEDDEAYRATGRDNDKKKIKMKKAKKKVV